MRKSHSTGVGEGVLTQTVGPWQRPVTYLSKRLHIQELRDGHHARALAATVGFGQAKDKLTIGL